MISIDDFVKVEMRVGEIKSAEKVPETDKLLKLSVDFGEFGLKQVVSGIALHVPDPQTLVGKHIGFVFNLEPRTIRGLESQAMILAASAGEAFSPAVFDGIPAGTLIK